jgi:hypothetical protein
MTKMALIVANTQRRTLFCVWIVTGNPVQPLECVWIDRDQRKFANCEESEPPRLRLCA